MGLSRVLALLDAAQVKAMSEGRYDVARRVVRCRTFVLGLAD